MNQWVIISDIQLIKRLSELTIQWMRLVAVTDAEVAKRMGLNRLIAAFQHGLDGICRNAPCLAIAYTLSSYPGGVKDAVIAASHFELLLPSFGLGGCWAGYLMRAFQHLPETKQLLGLDESYIVHAALMVGYPIYQYSKIPTRNSPQIKWL
jgi:hypothetical protein